MSAATVTWDERDSSATSSAGRFFDDFLPLVLGVSYRAGNNRGYGEIWVGKVCMKLKLTSRPKRRRVVSG